MRNKFILIPVVAILIIIAIFALPKKHTDKIIAPQLPVYAAIGDSVAAGFGLETASDSSACGKTNESYPTLAAISLNMRLKSFACSNATMSEGILGNQSVNNLSVAAQLDQVFAGEKPKLITITIGANDIGWTDILGKCVTGTCGSDSDTAVIESKLQTLKMNLKEAIQRMQSRYKTATPVVLVTGYYRVFPDSSDCSSIVGIDSAEQKWWGAQGDKLDVTLADASTGYNFVNFAPINFSGHDLCSNTPWIQGLNNKAPFHPNDDGQKVIGTTISQTFKALNK